MVIVIPYCERYNYLRLTLSTLRESLRGYEASILLYHTHRDAEVCKLDIFDDIFFNDQSNVISEYTHIRTRKDENLDYLIPTVINDAFSKTTDEYIILLDSDTIVHPKAIEMFLRMRKGCSDLGIGSLFNANRFPFLEIDETGDFGIKNQVGGFGWLIDRQAWSIYCSKIVTCWDAHAALAISSSNTHKIYCSVNSYLEHIGMTGSHRYEEKEIGDPVSIDRAWNFYN